MDTEIEELVRENNKLLKKLHRSMVVGRAFRIFYWVLIIGLAIGAFYFLQPYVESAFDLYDSLRSGTSSVESGRQSTEQIDEDSLMRLQELLQN